MTRWLRPLALSVVMHAAALGSGAWMLGMRGGETREPANVYPVALVVDPSLPGSPGPTGPPGRPGSIGPAPKRPTPRTSAPEPVSSRVPAPLPPAPAPLATGLSESTGGGGGGSGNGAGGAGGGGGGGGDGTGNGSGGGARSSYEPPRLLAGALPLDPDAGVALSIPPEIPVRLRVGADGRVKEIVSEIEHLPPAVLDALHRSADAMRFAPARIGGEPVEGWFAMTFVYRH